MPDAKGSKTKQKKPMSTDLARSPIDIFQCICSLLVRLGVFLFLRWIPTSLAWPALPIAFAGYTLSWLINDYRVRHLIKAWHNAPGGKDLQLLADGVQVNSEKIGRTIGSEHRAEASPRPSPSLVSTLKSFVTGVSVPSRRVNVVNFTIHLLAFALFIDSYASPYLFPSYYEHNLIFHRVADIGPTHAKVHIRWPEPIPLFQGFEEDVQGSGVLRDGLQRIPKPFRLVYRELPTGESQSKSSTFVAARWERGPLFELTPEDDWLSTVTVDNLWPSTQYEYRIAWAHNNTFVSSHRLVEFESEWPLSRRDGLERESLLAATHVGGHFRTWPDPRAGKGLGGLLVSSGIGENDYEVDDDEYGDSVPVDDPNQ